MLREPAPRQLLNTQVPFGTPLPQEYGIQLVRRDPFAVGELEAIFDLVASKVDAEPGVRPLYFPSFDQEASARENEELLRARGIEVASAARWASDDIVYSPGWA